MFQHQNMHECWAQPEVYRWSNCVMKSAMSAKALNLKCWLAMYWSFARKMLASINFLEKFPTTWMPRAWLARNIQLVAQHNHKCNLKRWWPHIEVLDSCWALSKRAYYGTFSWKGSDTPYFPAPNVQNIPQLSYCTSAWSRIAHMQKPKDFNLVEHSFNSSGYYAHISCTLSSPLLHVFFLFSIVEWLDCQGYVTKLAQ